MMQEGSIVKTAVVSPGLETPVIEIANRLMERRISAMPVIDAEGHVVGIVSESDLMRRLHAGGEPGRSWWLTLIAASEERPPEFIKSHGQLARDVMTGNPVTVGEDASLVARKDRHAARDASNQTRARTARGQARRYRQPGEPAPGHRGTPTRAAGFIRRPRRSPTGDRGHTQLRRECPIRRCSGGRGNRLALGRNEKRGGTQGDRSRRGNRHRCQAHRFPSGHFPPEGARGHVGRVGRTRLG